jgi:hypothetical protein
MKGIYEGIYIHGLNSTSGPSVESEKEKLILYAVKHLEAQVLNQGNI